MLYFTLHLRRGTVNVHFFAQYIFSRTSRRALDALNFDVSENYNHNGTNIMNWHVRKNITTRICLLGLGLDVQKCSSAKESTFTVVPNISTQKDIELFHLSQIS